MKEKREYLSFVLQSCFELDCAYLAGRFINRAFNENVIDRLEYNYLIRSASCLAW